MDLRTTFTRADWCISSTGRPTARTSRRLPVTSLASGSRSSRLWRSTLQRSGRRCTWIGMLSGKRCACPTTKTSPRRSNGLMRRRIETGQAVASGAGTTTSDGSSSAERTTNRMRPARAATRSRFCSPRRCRTATTRKAFTRCFATIGRIWNEVLGNVLGRWKLLATYRAR